MRHAAAYITLALVLSQAFPTPAWAAPESMTRDEIIALGSGVVGYSYWWGHGCWRTDGTEQEGSCSGSCPDCTHTGSYGADCSGFVAKAWQVPDPIAVETNAHPFSTKSFRHSMTHWSQVSRDTAQRADAFVYRNESNTSGHVVLYDSGDPWGNLYVYECRGCSYGCVYNLRTLSDSYIAIQRDLVDETAGDGTLRGVVFEDQGSGTNDMSSRIPGAMVSIVGHGSQTADSPDAAWSFSLPPGNYTVTASASGYRDSSRTCDVSASDTTWCSVGLLEDVCTPRCGIRACGPDPDCGESCGTCTAPKTCDAQGSCTCTKDCGGRECGHDPVCFELCGECPAGQFCNAEWQCTEGSACDAACGGRACGLTPSCVKSCGRCREDEACDDDGQCQAIRADQGKLFGRVLGTNDEGAPNEQNVAVSNAEVVAVRGETTRTDEAGYYELLVAPGEYRVTAALELVSGETTCSVEAGGHSECDIVIGLDSGEDPGPQEFNGGCAAVGGSSPCVMLLMGLGLLLTRRQRQNRISRADHDNAVRTC